MQVRIFHGAHSYAFLTLANGFRFDIQLSHGKSAPKSLREYATDNRERARLLIEKAELAEQAATILESENV